MEPIISVEGLSKRYVRNEVSALRALRERLGRSLRGRSAFPVEGDAENEFWALRDISFTVDQGDVIGIIGRNGAGKSTLLKILSRITKPTSGVARIRGRVGSLLEVGTGFHPELTGRENIFLNGTILGMSKAEVQRKFDEIVDFSGVSAFIDMPVKRYSSGMRTRLGFSVAAHLEPEILVVDEVLSVGDAEFQKKCLGKMKHVASQGRTVFFVSHSMNSVQHLCSRALWLDGGELRLDSDDVRKATLAYLENGQSRGLAEWVGDGSEFPGLPIAPRRLAITGANGAPLSSAASNHEQMWVHLDVDVHDLDPALTVGYALYTEAGEMLYWSYQTDGSQEQWPALEQGLVRLRSPLPRRWLNEGVYRVQLIASLHYRKWLFEPGNSAPTVSFEVQGGLSDSPLWQARRGGLLAPVLPWERVHDHCEIQR